MLRTINIARVTRFFGTRREVDVEGEPITNGHSAKALPPSCACYDVLFRCSGGKTGNKRHIESRMVDY